MRIEQQIGLGLGQPVFALERLVEQVIQNLPIQVRLLTIVTQEGG